MRVLHYVNEGNLSWAIPWIQLILGMQSKGIDNVVLCPGQGTLSAQFQERGIPVFPYKPVVSWAPWVCQGFGQLLKRLSPDLIHTRLFSAAVIGGYWGKKLGIPVVGTIDSRPKSKYFRFVDRTIAISSCIKEQAIESGMDSQKIDVIPNAIDAHYYHRPPGFNPQTVRGKYAIVPEDKIIIGAGRFVDWKGFDVLIEAFKKLDREDTWLLLAGTGEEEEKLKNLAGSNPRIIFLGFVDDIRPYFWAADVYVLPSRLPEPFGLSLLEAMASGLLCVATHMGGPLDMITHSAEGWLVPQDSAASMKITLAQVLDADTATKNLILEKAKQKVSSFDVERISSLYAGYYKFLVK